MVAESTNGSAILVGRGDGQFFVGQQLSSDRPNDIAIGDISGDATLDVILSMSAGVEIYNGRGDGQFNLVNTLTSGTGPFRDVAVSDLDGDNLNDVVALTTLGATRSRVVAWLSRGEGEFAAPQQFIAGASSQGMAIADLNTDGLEDIISSTPLLIHLQRP